MSTPLLKIALAPLIEKHRRLRSLYASGVAWFLAALTAAGLLLSQFGKSSALLGAAGVFILARLIGRRRGGGWEPDYRGIARTIEEHHPELHALLRTAVEQQPDPRTMQLSYLQQRVVADAAATTRRHQWFDTIPTSHWIGAHLLRVLGLSAAAAVFMAKVAPAPAPRASAASSPAHEAVTVTPGNTEIERGTGLVVLAKFHRDVPTEAILVLHPKNQPEQRMPLVRNLSDPVFGGGLTEVDADLTYRIEYAGQNTRDFNVKVFEYPRLERADATLDFPGYTKLPEKKIPDTHRVSAVEGTKLGITFQLNKPVKSATLIARDGTKLPLAVPAGKPLAELRDFPLNASQTYELQLHDADGRANKIPAQFIVEALPNRRPELKVATPRGDSRVSPLEEVTFRGEAWDDFGMPRYGLSYSIGGGATKDLQLGGETKADEKQSLAHLLKLEEIGVKPDELVSWYLWAEDTGPDGKSRRTATDMYFAEVRPFEEIYKQGDEGESESGRQGQGNAAEKLAQLQKQIISATWNLQRSEEAAGSPQPTPKYLKDEPVIRDSQAEALNQAAAVGAKLEDPKSKGLVESATREMQSALDRLGEAAKTAGPLPRAIAAEQSAYNALLKLAAHEFSVTRQRGKSGREASQRNQQQLDELELKEDKKRYETKREADPQQNEQQREQLAILNRLKELAQRQKDINERVKEMQTALQEAKTEKEKEELRRQLKRLREEEQQMLADIDELKQKMEQSPQQSQLADERRQLEQTRGEAQKAAEAMENGAASQALANGTRAARDLQQMRDDFRKKTSNQFRDEMREMRADARELADRQQQIGERLESEATKPGRPTLDGSSERDKLGEQFEKQQKQLGKITDDMKRVSEQAEAAEPLLARELYDALRKTAQAGTNETLEKTQALAERGYKPQARKFEEKARQEIDDLKTGVEKAAESVLGDEAEALRQARAELDSLARQLNREIAQNRPDLAQNQPAQEAQNPGGARDPRAGDGSFTPRNENVDPGKAPNPDDRTPGESPTAGREPRPQTGEFPSREGERGTPASAQGAKQQASNEGRPGEQARRQQREGAKPDEQQGRQPGERGQMAQSNKGSQPGQRGEGEQPGEDPQTAQGQQPGENGKGGQSGRGEVAESGRQTGERGGENPPGRDGLPAQPSGARPGARLAELANDPRQRGGADGRGGAWGGPAEGEQAGPLTGGKFVEWQDRLRNVEEMLDAPELRNEVARVREIARGVRAEFKRHSVAPNWDMVNTKIRAPLAELRDRLTEELARRESKENIVPIDRDPVPARFAERVRQYYEDLGRSR